MKIYEQKERLVPLLDSILQKPVDLGIGSLAVSINPDGRICTINRPHHKHGYITLSSVEQFPNDKWYDTPFVRNYRRQLAVNSTGFGVTPLGFTTQPEVFLGEGDHPVFKWEEGELEIYSSFVAEKRRDGNVLVQTVDLINHTGENAAVPLEFGGQLSLNRSSYGQLTEGGPIPIPPVENALTVFGNKLVLQNKNLGARAEIVVFEDSQPLLLGDEQKTADEAITLNETFEIEVQANGKKTITLVYTVGEYEDEVLLEPNFTIQTESRDKEVIAPVDWKEFVINRNIDYIVNCCSVPLGEESVCIITDHQLLPLAWNRDAYYMVHLLFASLSYRENDAWKQKVQDIIKGHLLWMFEDAGRPEGYWGRAYLTNGYSKDQIFQLDQQCYPILELCDYYQEFKDIETVERIQPVVKEVLAMLMEHKSETHWLFKTAETPADDEVEYPYHFSSQVLMWKMLVELDKLNHETKLFEENFGEMAEKVRRDCVSNFTYNKDNKELFAYLTDLNGGYQLYHDANDLPTVFAPIWGFCDVNDLEWRETMEFAFSQENKGGYYAGPFEGLGSVHTPHKWPLGDGQELLYAELINDEQRKENVETKLRKTVQWDGMFSEAVFEETGEVASRHWFSWPGAFISYVFIMLENSK
ncbi:glycoside hydrolase family 125 protein [Fredinandcohnia sp. 179-A 10B2 NHS]|uniref:glycoside hydrolase family 125 protein n=1 Tax=Fredinandcohnia sp. 179-A 10B2 NHS TaxID=3235176 RepID=UPI0039A3499E